MYHTISFWHCASLFVMRMIVAVVLLQYLKKQNHMPKFGFAIHFESLRISISVLGSHWRKVSKRVSKRSFKRLQNDAYLTEPKIGNGVSTCSFSIGLRYIVSMNKIRQWLQLIDVISKMTIHWLRLLGNWLLVYGGSKSIFKYKFIRKHALDNITIKSLNLAWQLQSRSMATCMHGGQSHAQLLKIADP